MHSASSRFNGITLYTTLVLAAMCLLNFAHGYLIYTPKASVALDVKAVTNFIDTKLWEQASFKYSLAAGTIPDTQTSPRSTPGTSSSSTSTSSSSGPTQSRR